MSILRLISCLHPTPKTYKSFNIVSINHRKHTNLLIINKLHLKYLFKFNLNF